MMLSSVSKQALSLQDVSKKNERSPVNEVHLVVMRLLSVFMSRTKSGSKSSICEVYSSKCFFRSVMWLGSFSSSKMV